MHGAEAAPAGTPGCKRPMPCALGLASRTPQQHLCHLSIPCLHRHRQRRLVQRLQLAAAAAGGDDAGAGRQRVVSAHNGQHTLRRSHDAVLSVACCIAALIHPHLL